MSQKIELVVNGVVVATRSNTFPRSRSIIIEEIFGHNNVDGRISRHILKELATLGEQGYTPRNDLRVDECGKWIDPSSIVFAEGVRVTIKEARWIFVRIKSINRQKNSANVVIDDSFDATEYTWPLDELEIVQDFNSYDANCMFAFILHGFLKDAEKYPTAYWFSDKCDNWMILNGVKPMYRYSSKLAPRYGVIDKDVVVVVEKDGPIAFVPAGIFALKQGNGFRIPVTDYFSEGEIKHREHAMYFHFKFARSGNELLAQAWLQVAQQLPV